ncbi:DUF6549 family protein [Viscerimonas tarda]
MKLNCILIAAVALMSSATFFLYRHGKQLEAERNTYKGNTNALLSEVKRMKIDSATTAVDVKTLSLMVDEYELYRTADLEKIKQMGVELRNLKMAAKHELSVNAPLEADLRDSVVIRDTVRIAVKAVEVNTPYLQVSGIIENNHLSGNIRLPVTLRQAVWIEPKHRFLWWRWGVKAVHQTISSDNPHVEINYSEVVEIRR